MTNLDFVARTIANGIVTPLNCAEYDYCEAEYKCSGYERSCAGVFNCPVTEGDSWGCTGTIQFDCSENFHCEYTHVCSWNVKYFCYPSTAAHCIPGPTTYHC